jgi:hypothetical protein
MTNFKDNAGRDWQLAVNVDSIKRVRGLADVDLLQAVEGTLLNTLSEDPVKLVDVLFALVKPAADKLGISDEAFGAAMAGDAIEHATTAFMSELINFFPTAKRTAIRAAREKYCEVLTKTYAATTAKVRELDVDALLLKALGDSSTSSPASSASTPAHSPSENSETWPRLAVEKSGDVPA